MINTVYWHDAASISAICKVLRCGGVVAGVSDTIFGLLAPLDDEGRARLDEIKGRQNKPYIVLVASDDEISKYVDAAQLLQIENIAKKCWPGPLTVIFKAKPDVPACLKSPEGTVAIRVPQHKGLQQLLACSGPLFSTSANKAGQPVPTTADELDPEIYHSVQMVVLDGSKTSSTLPSTILDVSGPEIKIVREGALPRKELISLLGDGVARRVG